MTQSFFELGCTDGFLHDSDLGRIEGRRRKKRGEEVDEEKRRGGRGEEEVGE